MPQSQSTVRGGEDESAVTEDSQKIRIGRQEDRGVAVEDPFGALEGTNEAVELGVAGVGLGQDLEGFGLTFAADHLGAGQGRVDFQDVSFSYLPGKPVLAGLSVSVAAGEFVAIAMLISPAAPLQPR